MTSIGMTQESDPTVNNPAAWAAGRSDESQSGTFWALAWSQDDDSVAEPLPYVGERFEESAVPAGETVERSSAPRYRRSTLLYGIAASFVAVAVGGLVVTVLNTDSVPATTSPVVVRPAESAVKVVSTPQIRPPASAPAAGPARVVPTATNARPIATNAPVSRIAEDAVKPAAPEAPAPEVVAPEVAPQAEPPAALPPVATPPIVTLPEFTPQSVPHPVGPTVIHVPHEGPMNSPLPDLGGSIPPINVHVAPEGPMHPIVPNLGVPLSPVMPAAPAAADPGITLHPVFTLPPVIPVLPSN